MKWTAIFLQFPIATQPSPLHRPRQRKCYELSCYDPWHTHLAYLPAPIEGVCVKKRKIKRVKVITMWIALFLFSELPLWKKTEYVRVRRQIISVTPFWRHWQLKSMSIHEYLWIRRCRKKSLETFTHKGSAWHVFMSASVLNFFKLFISYLTQPLVIALIKIKFLKRVRNS